LRVIICGGRSYNDRITAFQLFDRVNYHEGPITCVIEGGQLGADRLGRKWAIIRNIPFETVNANWAIGDFAGHMRNQLMLEKLPNFVIALPGNSGTADMMRRAEKHNIPIFTLDTLLL
jgi:hypothetical protein